MKFKQVLDKVRRNMSQHNYQMLVQYAEIYTEEEHKYLNRIQPQQIERCSSAHQRMLEIRLKETMVSAYELILACIEDGKLPVWQFPTSVEEVEERVIESYDKRPV